MELNTEKKSIALANMMRWGVFKHTKGADSCYIKVDEKGATPLGRLEPYSSSREGLAQFAEILLKFPEVMEEFVCSSSHMDERSTTAKRYEKYGGDFQGYLVESKPVTQESILDEVLRMKGLL